MLGTHLAGAEMQHGYLVGLFDILGFERKLASVGLAKMLAHYEALIESVKYRKEHERRVFIDMNFKESPYWSAEGDVSIFSKTHGAYASDSMLLWANRTWPEARAKSTEDFKRLSKDPASGWQYHPIPCDNFLEVCNELVCHGLEVGLPLRGAVSMGEAVLDQDRNIFLGQPIVDAARLEHGQRFIGASLCKRFEEQTIPRRFLIHFEKHLKEECKNESGGFVLDWPRHWRRTRTKNLVRIIEAMNVDRRYAPYYENTLDLIAASASFSGQFESLEDTSIRSIYKEFSYSNSELAVSAVAVRRVPIGSRSK